MESRKNNFDVAVVGAGPAGIMAAGKAASLGLSVVLIEKNPGPGKKLLLTGGGRCNITNLETNLRELAKNYNNGEFLYHAFSTFGPKETVEFFESLGVKTKVENGNRVFPASNKAEKVLEALEKYLAQNKVALLFGSEVTAVECDGTKIAKLVLKDRDIKAKRYILCTGGKSFSSTGSTGFGFKMAEKLGHSVTEPSPSLCPVAVKEAWAKNLPGISLKNVKISAVQNGKKQFSKEGEIVFTHFGLSGPAVLNISGKLKGLLEQGPVKISLDLFPQLSQQEVSKEFDEIIKKYPGRSYKNILSLLTPEKMAESLLEALPADPGKIANSMPREEREAIIKMLKNLEFQVQDTLGFEQSMVTQGGISLKEIDHKTMRSKIVKNLSFAGEIIDVDGQTGGFNLQMCWSTGFIAGQNCQ